MTMFLVPLNLVDGQPCRVNLNKPFISLVVPVFSNTGILPDANHRQYPQARW